MKIEIPLNDKSMYAVQQEQIDKWVELYPAIDVVLELKAMIGWCDSNPKKRKTRKGVQTFITNWLKRAQDKGGSPHATGKVGRGKPMRDMDDRDMLCDISWLPEKDKPAARQYFLQKYGYVYEG